VLLGITHTCLEKTGMTREAHTEKLLLISSGWSDNYGYAYFINRLVSLFNLKNKRCMNPRIEILPEKKTN
jgi:hypothetical protein